MPSEISYQSLVERESQLWGESKIDKRVSWFDSPAIARHINQCISGRPDCDWLDYVKENYFPQPAGLGLNVGCGHGELERHILTRNIVTHMHGCDISPGAVAIATQQAQENELGERVDYFTADANFLEQSSLHDRYDVIFASMALHHFAELEKCLDQLKKRLKRKGLLIVNEFVGPDRFQWSDAQLDAANCILQTIPLELRRNVREPDKIVTEITRPGLDYMKEHFAFEAICAERIPTALKKRFKLLEENPYGGTILHLLFEAIMDNFKEETVREHAAIVQSAIVTETLLLRHGSLTHDHVFYVCQR